MPGLEAAAEAEILAYREIPKDARDASAGNLFTCAPWIESVADSFALDFYHQPAREPGPPLVFALLDDALGKRIVAPPFGDYLIRGDGLELRNAVDRLRRRFPDHSLSLKIAGECDLPSGAVQREGLLQRIDLKSQSRPSPAFRHKVRQAKRLGLEVRRTSDIRQLDGFYELYAQQRLKKFGLLPQPSGFFRRLGEAFFKNDEGFLLAAHDSGRDIAFLFVLRFADTFYYKFSCADPGALSKRPYNLLLSHLIDAGEREGLAAIDLGLTPLGGSAPGLAQFKKSSGAGSEPLRTYRFAPLAGEDCRAEGQKALLSEITARVANSNSSSAAASAVASALYRYFA